MNENQGMSEAKVISLSVVGLLFLVLILAFFFGSWFTVEPGQVAFIKRLGVLQETTYSPGFYFKRPIMDDVIEFSVQTQKEQVVASAASKDLQDVSAEVAVNFQYNPEKVREIYTTIGNSDIVSNRIIAPSIQEVIKSVTAIYTASELVTKRGSVSEDITNQLKEKLGKYGLLVVDVNIVDFQFSNSFNVAIEAKVRAEQDALAQKNLLEKVKYEAQQQIETAKAQAEAIRIQAQAIQQQGGENYVQLKWVEKWDGKLPQYTLGENMNLLMNMSQ